MSAANPPRASDVLALHQELPNDSGASCLCGEWQSIRFGAVDTGRWSYANHLLDALNEAGFAVIKMMSAAATDPGPECFIGCAADCNSCGRTSNAYIAIAQPLERN